jgi:dimethylglycine dehydrogenase
VGRCTSGGYGWRLGKSVAMGMVPPEMGEEGETFEVEILGKRYPAVIIPDSPYDADNVRLRA